MLLDQTSVTLSLEYKLHPSVSLDFFLNRKQENLLSLSSITKSQGEKSMREV